MTTVRRRFVTTLVRSRPAIVTVAAVYVIGVLAGATMVHAGNRFALNHRDRIVGRAQSSAILTQDRAGRRIAAAQFDFAANLFLGAAPSTIVGIVNPGGVYVIALYRGWIGGIVSVNRTHTSRLTIPRRAAYYVSALTLQLIPFTLAGAVGVQLGRARRNAKGLAYRVGPFGIPVDAWIDALRIYSLVVPLFFLASLWEFLSPWR